MRAGGPVTATRVRGTERAPEAVVGAQILIESRPHSDDGPGSSCLGVTVTSCRRLTPSAREVSLFPLQNQIMNYAWGDRRAIAALQGREPGDEPEAELWMGAHPKAPSSALIAGEWLRLDRAIAEGPPARLLGERVAAHFGQLPFLFKVLAAARPLSLQAHPNLEQARAGFAREEAARVPRHAPHRNYKDDNHKPELICALSRFEALCGFRSVHELRLLVTTVNSAALAPWFDALWSGESDEIALRTCFTHLMQAPADERARLMHAVRERLSELLEHPEFGAAFGWALRLDQAYAEDVGVITSLMLNHVVLSPGEALYLPAGCLHAYLQGTGLELMANSDNVLRGGLTPKHVDVTELLGVLDFVGGPVHKLSPQRVSEGQLRYQTPAVEFELWKHELGPSPQSIDSSDGPEILICTEGRAAHETSESIIALLPGESAWVPAATSGYTLIGPGTVYRALVPS